jgi:hypothetical protein
MTIITIITRDRAWTTEEAERIEVANQDSIAAGTQGPTVAFSAEATGLPQTTVRIWTTTDAANAYVAMINGFTPPPTSATVQTY